ncbi:MAG: ABC transporter permease [Deltaproteobacteria bacterium]|nr:MAG: ABC transporter permease [Deltaproteobacteria bacterium]TMQ20332.1 MAG: ABC transporter permease [Deltaproteobacteria bacterium]
MTTAIVSPVPEIRRTRPTWFPHWCLPLATGLLLLAAWWLASSAKVFPTGTVPSPADVASAFATEADSGRLLENVIASLYRVAWGYLSATIAAVPLGLVIGRSASTRAALLPWINFFRSLSPIAWIPFAIIWFGIGDPPAIFLIFLATFFQIVLATAAATGSVPSVYYRVAREMELGPAAVLFRVTFPAILPQLVIALRVAAGVAWMVVVAAEMIAVRSGLGFLIVDARNGLRMDLVVFGMLVIGLIGMALDIVFARLAKVGGVRWGFER